MTQLDLIEKIGIENYIAAHLGSWRTAAGQEVRLAGPARPRRYCMTCARPF
jgi:hypothetical protein